MLLASPVRRKIVRSAHYLAATGDVRATNNFTAWKTSRAPSRQPIDRACLDVKDIVVCRLFFLSSSSVNVTTSIAISASVGLRLPVWSLCLSVRWHI